MDNNINEIESKLAKLSEFFTIFGKKELQKDINTDLKDIKEIFDSVVGEFDTYKQKSKDDIDTINSQFNTHKQKTQKEKESLNDRIDDTVSKLDNINIKHNLISKLLAARSSNQGLFDYKKILYTKFMDFANAEESLANEAAAILKLQAIEKELEVITAYPELYKKNTLAVGGGFSSGKSEFISSFFENEIKLPIGIEPTTAIPAYVVNSDTQHIFGCSNKGGAVDLKSIDENLHLKLSHNFIKSFDFNLKEIMPFMVYGTQIEHEHICFIDTPGYNPSDADTGYTSEDITTAKEFLDNATTFLWLIGADANGTIPSSDLDFLSDLDLEKKKVYVVLNKADLRGASDIEDILDEIQESLSDYDIEIAGISAYSAINKKEYSYRKQSIIDFIKECNTEAQVHKDMVVKLYEVYNMYKHAILKNIKEKEAVKLGIKSVALDLIQEGIDHTDTKMFDRLDKLKIVFDTKKQKDNIKLLDKVIIDLKDAIDGVFGSKLAIKIDNIKINDIKIDDAYDFKIKDKVEYMDDIEEIENTTKKEDSTKDESDEKEEVSPFWNTKFFGVK